MRKVHHSIPSRPQAAFFKAGMIAALALLILNSAPSLAEDRNVSTVLYYNNGGYTVKSLKLHWIGEDSQEQHKKFTGDLTLGQGFCYDIKSANKQDDVSIPDGAEIWLSYNISAGDRKSCRKDDSKITYSSRSLKEQYYLSGGTTLNNNRCKMKKPPTSVVVGRSTGNCEFDINY